MELHFGAAYADKLVPEINTLIIVNGTDGIGAFRIQQPTDVCGQKAHKTRFPDIRMIFPQNAQIA